MTTETATPNPATTYLATARDLYLGWVDASLHANERFARVARVWIDEALAAQQDVAETIRRAIADAQENATAEAGEPATPFAFLNRAGEIARTNYLLWSEAGLKAQERFTRVAQVAFEELQGAQTAIAQRTEEQFGEITRRNGARAK